MRPMGKASARSAAGKRPTNISLSVPLLEEARTLGVNVSQACERGLEEQVREMRARLWLEANRAALDSCNRFVEEKGLPLADYRQF